MSRHGPSPGGERPTIAIWFDNDGYAAEQWSLQLTADGLPTRPASDEQTVYRLLDDPSLRVAVLIADINYAHPRYRSPGARLCAHARETYGVAVFGVSVDPVGPAVEWFRRCGDGFFWKSSLGRDWAKLCRALSPWFAGAQP